MSGNTEALNVALSGRYRIEHQLGAGGMATVYLAHDIKHDRRVALNVLPDSVARRSLSIRVLDNRGRATRAGAEVRVYAAGTRRVLATRLVDAGSGYDAQSDVPVHIGLPTAAPVDVEVAWPAPGQRRIVRRSNVAVDGRRVLEVRVP